jgi:cell division protein FtsB
MKLTRILVSVWTGFLAYSLLMIFYGPSGRARTEDLLGQREEMLRNIAELGELNRDLAGRLEILKTDPDAISLEARKLGYLSPNETMVRISGAKADKKFSNIGSVLQFEEKEWPWGIYYKAAGFLAAFACWISLGMAERNSCNGGKKRRFQLRGGSFEAS